MICTARLRCLQRKSEEILDYRSTYPALNFIVLSLRKLASVLESSFLRIPDVLCEWFQLWSTIYGVTFQYYCPAKSHNHIRTIFVTTNFRLLLFYLIKMSKDQKHTAWLIIIWVYGFLCKYLQLVEISTSNIIRLLLQL